MNGPAAEHSTISLSSGIARTSGAVRFRPEAEGRFWEKVEKGPDCWLWLGGKNNGGYGSFKAGGLHHPHRYSWALANGPIPDGLQINHHCDNRICVNPAHLYAGTKKENSGDMVARGRVSRGSRRPLAKITEAEVPFIRHWAVLGYKQDDIADAFGLSQSAVSLITLGRTWRHAA